MTHLVTDKCVACRYTDCVEVCPVDCFYAVDDLLVIDPDACIDCGVCIPECPIDAIVDENMFIQEGDNIGEILEKYNVVQFCNIIYDVGCNDLQYFICQGLHKLLCDGIDIFSNDINNDNNIIKFKELCVKSNIFLEFFNNIYNTIYEYKYNEKNAIIFSYIINYFCSKNGKNITKKESSLIHEDSDKVDYDSLEYKFKLINKYW